MHMWKLGCRKYAIRHCGSFTRVFDKRKPFKMIPPKVTKPQNSPRTNELDIQMIPRDLYEKIFKNAPLPQTDSSTVAKCKRELQKHGMITKPKDYVADINFQLPPLEGADLQEHFQIIGENQAKPYRTIVEKLLQGIPPSPKTWEMRKGWTRYAPNEKPRHVPYPLEDGLVFDVEVCVRVGKAPTLATAVSSEAWYGWISESLIDNTYEATTGKEDYSLDCLIPMESTENDNEDELTEYMLRPKVIIGHNVAYDRARIKEQYWLERTAMRFIDTMSLHVCVSGLTSYQRAILKSGKKLEEDESWMSQSSLNNLDDVHQLYCGGERVEKSTRQIFVDGTLGDIKENFAEVMEYCSSDVRSTYNVLSKVFPMFLERFPHPVTLAGMLELSTVYLPVNSNWNRYIENSEQTYDDLDTESRLLLARRADNACRLLHDSKYKEDLWMWDQDWTVQDLKLKKGKRKTSTESEVVRDEDDGEDEFKRLKDKFSYLWLQEVSSRGNFLPGYPQWYKKLCNRPGSPDWVPGPHLISTGMQMTPKLLNLTWEGYPLHFIRGKGWGFMVPFTRNANQTKDFPLEKLVERCPIMCYNLNSTSGDETTLTIATDVQNNLAKREYYSRAKKDKTEGVYNGTGVWCKTILNDCCYFFKLPHKDGASHRVGNPLAKDFLNKFSDNVLAGDTETAKHILAIARKLSYWRNNRDRIANQFVVWLDRCRRIGAIVPQVVVCGTLTRRAVEPTWLTASNAHPERLGSELRAMVQAPAGYSLVGADVDSQELWIASVIGDAHCAKRHGATPLGWMTLSGNKNDGTDMHSVTAKAVGTSRDHAKVLNYARIYGAGQNFAEHLLKQFNPTISDSDAKNKAQRMFTLTKGKKIFRLKPEFTNDFEDRPYSQWQAFEAAKACGKSVNEMFFKPTWFGGTESAMFNRLEEIACSDSPKTPFLGGHMSRALEVDGATTDRFLPTRVNWVVQSGAVDFLHLMLVCMRWILGDRARFCLSFHDEVRYLVKEDFKYQAALAMHVTNLLTRAFCAMRLGVNDLPQSVAFFSSVEIDTVLRKEAKQNCITPSNPHGLEKGYGIRPGESLDIVEAIRKAQGETAWYNFDRHVEGDETQTRPNGGASR